MYTISFSEISDELTEEEVAELKAADKKPLVYDEDCPYMNEEQLKQFVRFDKLVKTKIDR